MKKCFNCDKKGSDLFGYPVCAACKAKLRLFTPETIKKYSLKNPSAFKKEIERRLDFIEKDYIKKKIKLLHVKKILKNL